MAKIYNKSGALSDLLDKINDSEITTLKEVVNFKKNYKDEKKRIIDKAIIEVNRKILEMKEEIGRLENEKSKVQKNKKEELTHKIKDIELKSSNASSGWGFISRIVSKIKNKQQKFLIDRLRSNFDSIIADASSGIDKKLSKLEKSLEHTENSLKEVAMDNESSSLNRLDRINKTIIRERHLVYGSIGELKTISQLKKLPDSYHVINDYRRHFSKPIYNRNEDDYIYSIQVDHIVVGPTGLFIIETKYWSKKSISRNDLFSPIKQVKRAGFALFVVLNDAISFGFIDNLVNNWGSRKISPRQIVVSLNNVSHTDFQYVKVLNLDSLNSYITYGKEEFSTEDVNDLVSYLSKTNT